MKQKGFEVFGDGGAGGGGAAVARHDRATGGTDLFATEDMLREFEALVANMGDLRLDYEVVAEMHLPMEVDIEMDDDDGEVALLGREPDGGEEGLFAKVEIFHEDGIVDVTHLVDIVETDLDWEGVGHGDSEVQEFRSSGVQTIEFGTGNLGVM